MASINIALDNEPALPEEQKEGGWTMAECIGAVVLLLEAACNGTKLYGVSWRLVDVSSWLNRIDRRRLPCLLSCHVSNVIY